MKCILSGSHNVIQVFSFLLNQLILTWIQQIQQIFQSPVKSTLFNLDSGIMYA